MRLGIKINHDIKRQSSFAKNVSRWLNQRSTLAHMKNRLQWHWYPRLFVESNYPVHIDIELSSRCNLKCPMCFREHREIPIQNTMDFELFKRIIDEIEGKVYSIKLTGRGEPQMSKFPQFMEYLKGKKFGEVSMITNGLLMTEEKMHSIIDSGMDFVIFSIDGLKENYEKIRYPGKYEDIIEKVARLHEIRKERGATKPMIRIQSVMIPEEEQKEFLNIWEPISDDILFLVFKNYSKDAENIQLENYPCPMPFQRMMIHHNGTVPMCINDEYEIAVQGDLNVQSVKEIWQGDQYKTTRKVHRCGQRTEKYSNCAKCALTRVGHGDD
jgi:radical SAM protein with 4Fe4S-binding SPASM domain